MFEHVAEVQGSSEGNYQEHILKSLRESRDENKPADSNDLLSVVIFSG